MKKILLVLLTLTSAILLAGCVKSTKKETLIVGMEADYAPYNWTSKKNNFTHPIFNQSGSFVDGYDVAIAKIISNKIGKNLVIKAIAWDGLLPALKSNEIDAIIAGMSATEERKKEIAFSDKYYRSNQVLIVNKNGKFADKTKLSDFKVDGARIVAQRGTLQDDLIINQIGSEYRLEPLDTYPALATAVSSNAADAFVASHDVAKTIILSNKNLKIINFKDGDGFIVDESEITVSIGLRLSDTKLLEDINKALSEISEEEQESIMDSVILRHAGELKTGIFSLFTNYFHLFARGLLVTLMLAIIGTVGGFFLSLLFVSLNTNLIDKKRDSSLSIFFKKFGQIFTRIYVTVFRGTPMIVQAMILYYGIRSLGNFDFWTPLVASAFIVVLNTAAYIAEIIRGSVNAIDKGQNEASLALGMNRNQTLNNVVYPQAIRNSLPAIGNEFIVNLKDTAVLSIIGVLDLFNATRQVVGATYSTIAPFVIVAIIYLILTSLTSILVKKLETKKEI